MPLPATLGRSIVFSLLCLFGTAVWAADVPTPIVMHHTSWTAREGAPQMVITMTQTRDGWLWLGGSNGLFRFDGVRFEAYDRPLPSAGIAILNAFDDGSLWIGYRYGGVSVLSHGQLRNYGERDGLPANAAVWGLEHDSQGRMWAATNRGLYHLDGERWLAAGADFALPMVGFKTLMLDRQRNLWAQGNNGVFELRANERRFIKAGPENGTGVLFQFPDESVWSWDALHSVARRLTQPASGAPAQPLALADDLASLLVDRQGGLWAGRVAELEYHTANGIQRSGREQGLSGQWVAALFEDGEGSIWASTSTGIDRFRHQRISPVHFAQEAVGAPLQADADGGVWVGKVHFVRQPDGSFVQQPLRLTPVTMGEEGPSALYRDPAGIQWFGGNGRIWRRRGQQLRVFQGPPNMDLGWALSLSSDDSGALWAVWPRGLLRLDANEHWQDMTADTGMKNETPRVSASSPQQGLWLGYAGSRVLQLQRGRWRRYGLSEGLDVGMVEALHVKNNHVWVGGEKGTALRQADRFIPLVGLDGHAFDGVSGIVELDNGDLWIDSGGGLIRIAASEIGKLAARSGYRVRYEVLDILDGLSGNSPLRYPSPSMIQTTDAQLWLSTNSGIFRLDAMARQTPRPPATTLIRSLGPPGQLIPAQPGMRLAQGTTALQIDYTALALAMPERVAFRYRLDGVDTQWQQVGTRRTAYYNNLGPGDYRFRVEASNYAGEWAEQPTTLDFQIAPTIPQSWWFRTLCALVMLAACWLLYQRRMRNFAAQAVARLEERTQERERIARELHDTLLQSVQAMILHVHAATLKLPAPDPARIQIEQALQQADDVMVEGRERVRDLRDNEPQQQNLVEAIRAADNRLSAPGVASLQVAVDGEVRQLHPAIYPEVLSIVCEAIANAYRHANASRIDVRIVYRAGELRIIISDDGAGIPAEIIAAGGRSNHWGICGMRERAARIKAKLALRSDVGAGTEWRLTLPGVLAYQPASPRFRFWRRPPAA
jgi:signal transduction histidine kinase/ligand-binding sensor domain-containing protein